MLKRSALRTRQHGVTLIIALIVLVMMTLTGIALVRSVDTTNLIAGNLAFQQSALHSGDSGVETAISWLEQNNSGANTGNLFVSHNSLVDCNGYTANRVDPPAGTSWDTWWNSLGVCQTVSLPADSSGNTVSYAIDRMCNSSGDPNQVPSPLCSQSPVITYSSPNSSKTSGYVQLNSSNQTYYRITARISGARWTKTYVQAIVAM